MLNNSYTLQTAKCSKTQIMNFLCRTYFSCCHFGKHIMLTSTCFVPLDLQFSIPTYVSTFCYRTGLTELT